MEKLSPIQVRVLGCLIEKKATTPEHYPLTLNSLRNACNQKSSRCPVTAYTEGEVGHAIRELEALELVREEWGARTPKYGHRAGRILDLHSKGLALVCTLMLRGPQTLGELKNHAHRLFEFDDLDDVQFAMQALLHHEPPLAADLPRQPGQKEGRYAHLLSGAPDLPVPTATAMTSPPSGLEARIENLELEVEALKARLEEIEAADTHYTTTGQGG